MKGVDVSYWQGVIDWNVLASKAEFVYIKASDRTSADRRFKANWTGAQKAGIPRGAYHFYHPNIDWKEQVTTFLREHNGDPGDLAWAIDVEVGNQTPWSVDQIRGLELFMRSMSMYAASDELAPPLIYTANWYWTSNIGTRAPWAASYGLWVASYIGTLVIPPPWTTYKLWQYSADGNRKGKEYGVQSVDIDLDIFNA